MLLLLILLGHFREQDPNSDQNREMFLWAELAVFTKISKLLLWHIFVLSLDKLCMMCFHILILLKTEMSTMHTFPLNREPEAPIGGSSVKIIEMYCPGMIRRPLCYWNQQGGSKSDSPEASKPTSMSAFITKIGIEYITSRSFILTVSVDNSLPMTTRRQLWSD